MTVRRDDAGMRALFAKRGLVTTISKNLGIASAGFWRRVPLEYVFVVAQISGLPPEQLRPDFFMLDPLRADSASKFYGRKPDSQIASLRETVTPSKLGRLTSPRVTASARHGVAGSLGEEWTQRRRRRSPPAGATAVLP